MNAEALVTARLRGTPRKVVDVSAERSSLVRRVLPDEKLMMANLVRETYEFGLELGKLLQEGQIGKDDALYSVVVFVGRKDAIFGLTVKQRDRLLYIGELAAEIGKGR